MSSDRAPRGVAALAANALALSLGEAIGPCSADAWSELLSLCVRERLAALAWTRSGRFIRATAPQPVVNAWRGLALAATELAERQLRALATLSAALDATGVRSTVLKGLPLALQLYGDASLRAATDIDLHVPLAERVSARATLERIGWRCVDGSAPWEESYESFDETGVLRLEVHSSALADRLAHIEGADPDSAIGEISGATIRVESGSTQPVFLAAHLAKHVLPPLLWFVDFATLWNSLDATQRTDAYERARALRVHRYLRWATDRAALLESAARGDVRALSMLGFTRSGRSEPHPIWRTIWLASALNDRVRVIGDWLVPRRVRGSASLLSVAASRLALRWRRLRGERAEYGHVAR